MSDIATLDDLLSAVLLDCPGLDDAQAREALRLAFSAFCRQSTAWRETLALTTVAAQAAYALTPTAQGATIWRVEGLRLDGRLEDEPAESYRYDDRDGKLYFEDDFVPARAGDAYAVTVSLAPERWATAYPALMLRRYGDAVAGGAAAGLLLLNRPWKNPDLYQIRRSQWRDGLALAMAEIQREGTARANCLEG